MELSENVNVKEPYEIQKIVTENINSYLAEAPF